MNRYRLGFVSRTGWGAFRAQWHRVLLLFLVLTVTGCGVEGDLVVTADPAVVETYPFEKNAHCEQAVAGNLAKYGVSGEQVKSITYSRITRSSSFRNRLTGERENDDILVGWQTWVRLKDRDGALIIHVDKDTCFTRQVYTRYGLSIPGLKQF